MSIPVTFDPQNALFGNEGDELKRQLGLTYLALFLIVGIVYIYKQLSAKRNAGNAGKGNIPQVNKWLSLISPFDLVYYLLQVKKHGTHIVDVYKKRYGRTYKIHSFAIKHYITSDPDVIQKILTSTDTNHLGKPTFFQRLIKLVGLKDSIFTLNGDAWQHRRKLLARPFSYKSIQSYLGTMNKSARLMIEDINLSMVPIENDKFLLEANALFESQNLFTIRTASAIVMGAEITSHEENVKFREDFRMSKDLAVARLYKPWTIYDLVYRLYDERKHFLHHHHGALQFVNKLISTYKEEQERLRIEGKLIKMMEESNEEYVGIGRRPYRSMIEEMLYAGLTDEEITYEVVTLMIGGHETTMTAIGSFILHMAINPDVQAKCRQEIDNFFKSRSSEREEDDDLTMDELADLKYLERCLMEVLRLTTSIPIFQRSIDAPLKIDEDNEIEAGSNVLINLWTLHRDPEYFPDPFKFDPDRFLPENCKSRHKYAYVPFSWGLRNCIAWKLAMVEIKLLMTWILRHFEIESVEPLKYEDIKFLYELTIKPDKEIHYFFKKRKI